jgi:hypothetical protein
MVDGTCVIYDWNKTVGKPQHHNANIQELAENLAAGLEV